MLPQPPAPIVPLPLDYSTARRRLRWRWIGCVTVFVFVHCVLSIGFGLHEVAREKVPLPPTTWDHAAHITFAILSLPIVPLLLDRVSDSSAFLLLVFLLNSALWGIAAFFAVRFAWRYQPAD